MKLFTAVKVIILILATLLAFTNVAFGGAMLWAKLTNHQIIVVSGGSMAPTFEVGDVIVVNVDKSQLAENDIITYQSNQGLTTHRLIEFQTVDGNEYVQTKGDANEQVDPNFTPVDAVVGSVERSFTGAGFVLNFMSSSEGRIATLAPILLFVLIYEMSIAVKVWREDDEEEDELAPLEKSSAP